MLDDPMIGGSCTTLRFETSTVDGPYELEAKMIVMRGRERVHMVMVDERRSSSKRWKLPRHSVKLLAGA